MIKSLGNSLSDLNFLNKKRMPLIKWAFFFRRKLERKKFMNKYLNNLYRRGFLLTDIPNPKFNNDQTQGRFTTWDKIELSRYNLFFDPDVESVIKKKNGFEIIILGHILNPFDGHSEIENIAEILLNKKISSEEVFLDYLDQLSGRFVIFSSTPTATEIYHDACATRTVFYDVKSTRAIISSHSTLIAEMSNYTESKFVKSLQKNPDFNRIRYLPGLQTPFDEVLPLTPNTKYIVEEKQVQRIFPRRPLETNSSIDNLVDDLIKIMQKQAKILNNKYNLSISLTAGIDSRLTYSMFKGLQRNIEYFTHVNLSNPESYKEDVEIAKKLAVIGDVKHKVFEYGYNKEDDGLSDFTHIWKKNVGMNRGSVYLFKMYADLFPSNRMHVRSNLAEIGRVYYKRNKNSLSAKSLAYLYTRTPLKYDKEIISHFQKFINITKFYQENFFNYDYFDLFYWEHRMCLWHSLIVLESDMAYDTHILYNNRLLLSKMLSAEYDVRINNELFLKIMKKVWPELLDLPINGQNCD